MTTRNLCNWEIEVVKYWDTYIIIIKGYTMIRLKIIATRLNSFPKKKEL